MDINEKREQMVREWGLQDLTPEEQAATIEKIGEVLYQNIVLRASELLSDGQLAALDKFTARKDEKLGAAEALEWLRAELDTFDTIASEETAKLKARIIAAPR
jgi:hypothetical protein